MPHLFVYGTLRNPRVVQQITGKRFRMESAILEGYRKVTPSRGYPYLIPNPEAKVFGYVLYDVDERSLQLLDHYEGSFYERCEVEILVPPRRFKGYVYVKRGGRGRRSPWLKNPRYL